MPFRFSSGGGRDVHFVEEKEVNLNDLVSGQLPKVAHDVAIKGAVRQGLNIQLSNRFVVSKFSFCC